MARRPKDPVERGLVPRRPTPGIGETPVPRVVRVKICGVTSVSDALLCAEAGADAVGFVLWPKSPRAVSLAAAQRICRRLPPFVSRVGVFVNEPIEGILGAVEACSLDWVQLAGDEDRADCHELSRRLGRARIMKTFRVDETFAPEVAFAGFEIQAFHLDSPAGRRYGGTGKEMSWDLAARATQVAPSVVLAGGLTPENVGRAIEKVRPAAVDVSSGVERSPGVKESELVRSFVAVARGFRPSDVGA